MILPLGVLGLVILAPIAVLLAISWVLGWRLQVVETASMRPLYPEGTLVVVQPIDAAAVKAGMVIVFRDPAQRDRLVAHRAVKRLPGVELMWQTKGDANRGPDPWPVSASDVRGHVRWGVPGLGRLLPVISGWTGAVTLIGGPLTLLATAELTNYLRRRRARPAT